MGYELRYTVQNEYLYFHIKADNKYETSKNLWTQLYDLCNRHARTKMLIVSDSEPLKVMPAYDHHTLIKEVGFTLRYQVAWVEKNQETIKIDEFIEDVLTNRGIIRAKLFADEPEAKKWLLANG